MPNRYTRTGQYVKCNRDGCETLIYTEPYLIKSGRKKFCSKPCLYSSGIQTKTFEKGHPKSFVGQKHSEETKSKISKSSRGKRTGDKNHSWKGGLSKVEKLIRRVPEYKEWRGAVFSRDNFTCQDCSGVGYVTAHHIKSFISIIRENNIKNIMEARECVELWDITNGKTLCEVCHSKTDNYKGRARINKNANIKTK